MIKDVQILLDGYWRWLRDRTSLREIEDWVEITTPYLDRHNDCLQIYARRDKGGFVLTDDGYILEDLASSGCEIATPRRRSLLATTVAGFGVELNGNTLETNATPENFALQKHNLIQAMLAVNDLFYFESPGVGNLFLEDVAEWLNHCDIRYTPGPKFSGHSGLDHHFDFVVPKSRAAPERLLRAINSPDRNTAQTMAFAWLDIRKVRPPDTRAYAILNDSDRSVSEGVTAAIRRYEVRPVKWSARDKARDDLAA